MKSSPDTVSEPEIAPDSSRMSDFLTNIGKKIRQDFGDRESWVEARDHFNRRRYGMEWRNPTTPWVGSSNIVLPVIDKKIDELKPQYINMILSPRPTVTAHAVMPRFQKKVRNVELLFDWIAHYGAPRFAEEVIFAADDCLEMGRAIFKSYWHYETRQGPTVLNASRLPPELRRLIVVDGNDQYADKVFLASGGQGGAVSLTKREFDGMREAVEMVVQKAFDLDPEEPRDQKAISKVIAWFRGGAKGDLVFESRDVIRSVPAMRTISPMDFIVPRNATCDVEEHERICEVMYFTRSQLQQTALDQKWNKGAVDEFLDRRKKGRVDRENGGGKTNAQRMLMDLQQASREGVAQATSDDLFEIWKVATRYSDSLGGAEKKVVALIAADAPDLPLKIKSHNRPSGKWGYHTYTFELNKRRWYSPRGVPELLDDLEAEITAAERAKINRMAIANCPTLKYKPNRHINPSSWKFFPGVMFPTVDPSGDVIPLQFAPLDVSFDSHIQQLSVWAEQRLGSADHSLANQGSLSEPRTKYEIQSIQSQARQTLSMRGTICKLAYDEMWGEFFDLWHSLGPDEVYVKVTGGDEPIKLTKEDLQGQFLIQCAGTIGSSDPAMEAQKAQNRIILLTQLAPLVEPQYKIDLGELVMDWLEKDDIRLLKRVVIERSPEEVEQIVKQQQMAAARDQQSQMALAAAGQKPSPSSGAKPSGMRPPKIPQMASRNGGGE